MLVWLNRFYQPASHKARSQLVLYVFRVCGLCICIYQVHHKHIVAMWLYFDQIVSDGCFEYPSTMSSLAQLQVRHSEKQRQCRCNDMKTESRNTRSEQLFVIPTEPLTNWEWLPGELLVVRNGQRPSWLLDMKYQTCSWKSSLFLITK